MTGGAHSFRIDPTRPVGGELRRVATARLERAASLLPDGSTPSVADRQKAAGALDSVRSLLRLVHDGMDPGSVRTATRRLHEAHQLIAANRPTTVVDIFERTARNASDTVTSAALQRLRMSLIQQAMLDASLRARSDVDADLTSMVPTERNESGPQASHDRWGFSPWVSLGEILDAAILDASLWVIAGVGFAPLAAGFERDYRLGRDGLAAMIDAMGSEDNDPDFNRNLVARIRDHQRHVALLRPVWPEELKVRSKEVRRLARKVGRASDLSALREVLMGYREPRLRRDARAVVGVLDDECQVLMGKIEALGLRVYADDPATAVDRVASWWPAPI